MDLRVVSSPRISIGPAGSRINRDHARRGWATETGHPSWGPRDPISSLTHAHIVTGAAAGRAML